MNTKKTSERITVVIPVRNRERLVCRTLDSVAAQTLLPARLIVVDNGSDDGTRDAVARWMDAHSGLPVDMVLADEAKPGASAARNRGLTLVETPYVAFFDSDDLMLPGHLERVERFIDAAGGPEIVYFDRAVRDDDGWTKVIGSDDGDLLRAQLLDCVLNTTGYVALASLVRDAGGWDEDLPRWNDYELGVRLLLGSSRVRKLSGEPSVLVSETDDSITGNSYSRDARDLERALDRIACDLRRAERLHEVKYVYARRVALSALYAREGASDDSRRLYDVALDQPPGGVGTALRLQLIFAAVRMTGNGSSALSRILLRKKEPRKLRK